MCALTCTGAESKAGIAFVASRFSHGGGGRGGGVDEGSRRVGRSEGNDVNRFASPLHLQLYPIPMFR